MCLNFFEILVLYFQNSKIQKYSPSESAKVYDKAINRKTGVHFHPKQTLDFLRSDMANSKLTEDVKRSIVRQYLDVSTAPRTHAPGHRAGLPTVPPRCTAPLGTVHSLFEPKTEHSLQIVWLISVKVKAMDQYPLILLGRLVPLLSGLIVCPCIHPRPLSQEDPSVQPWLSLNSQKSPMPLHPGGSG